MVILTVIIISFVTCILIRALRSPRQPIERAAVRARPVLIICGECSGDADIPHKTQMDIHGHCASCGGASYILASGRHVHAQRLIAQRKAAAQTERFRLIRGGAGTRK